MSMPIIVNDRQAKLAPLGTTVPQAQAQRIRTFAAALNRLAAQGPTAKAAVDKYTAELTEKLNALQVVVK